MKLLLITLIVLFFGIAQFSISQTTCFEADNNFVFEGSSSARSIAQGDFNNDGEIDIIMGNSLGASPDATLQRLVYIESTGSGNFAAPRSEEHTSELQSRPHLVCRLLLEKKKK